MDIKPEELLIYTFVTPGHVGWAGLYLESLRYRHGERFRVRIDGRDLNEQHMALLQRTYALSPSERPRNSIPITC